MNIKPLEDLRNAAQMLKLLRILQQDSDQEKAKKIPLKKLLPSLQGRNLKPHFKDPYPNQSTYYKWEAGEETIERYVFIVLIDVINEKRKDYHRPNVSMEEVEALLEAYGHKKLEAFEKEHFWPNMEMLPTIDAFVGSAPQQPQRWFGRDKMYWDIKKLIKACDDRTNNILAIYGMAGVGKTTFMNKLAHDKDLKTIYPFILFVSLGEKPNIQQELRRWAKESGCSVSRSESIDDIKSQLRAKVRKTRVLILIDDVWDYTHASAFLIGSSDSLTLITTRREPLAMKFASTEEYCHHMPVLLPEDAMLLLGAISKELVREYNHIAKDLAKYVEYLPLGLELSGNWIRNLIRYEEDVETHYKNFKDNQDILNQEIEIYGNSDDDSQDTNHEMERQKRLFNVFERSTDYIDKVNRKRFAYLAYMPPEPAGMNVSDLADLWRTTIPDAKKTTATLIENSLLKQENKIYKLHALLTVFAQALLAKGM